MLPQHYERKVVKDIGTMWEIDQKGRVWRIGRRWYNPHTDKTHILPCCRKRGEYQMPNGYLSLQAYVGDKRRNLSAHRLVWQHFFGDIPDNKEINHKNGDKADNRPNNLEVVTKADNAKHAVRLGLTVHVSLPGELNPNAALTLKQVGEIRLRYAGGETILDLAKVYPVGKSQVYNIVSNQAWH